VNAYKLNGYQQTVTKILRQQYTIITDSALMPSEVKFVARW
jgi:hypothetical protein